MINFDEFSILQYKGYYKMVKNCSITKKQYCVKIDAEDFRQYYTPFGKSVKHLKGLSKEDRIFLNTTLTPNEYALLTKAQKNTNVKLWKHYLKKIT